MKEKIEYPDKEVRVYEFPNMTVTVHIPDLPPEEYARRHKELERACVKILMAQEKAHRKLAENGQKI